MFIGELEKNLEPFLYFSYDILKGSSYSQKMHGLDGRGLCGRHDAANQLETAAVQATQAIMKTETDMDRQQSKVDQVATAMNEMTATVQEVARNTSFTADAILKADEWMPA